MSETEPRSENLLTQEQEMRKQRYLSNLENLQNSDWEEMYPTEMQKCEWTEVTDERELRQAREQPGFLVTDVPNQLYGLYRDVSGDNSYFVSRSSKFPKMREIQLDMLATAKEIAPWAKQQAIVYERPSSAKEAWSAKCGPWSFNGNIIRSDKVIMESMVNGLGDPEYSLEQKQGFLREDIAAIVHENAHIYNTDKLEFGVRELKISETAPLAAEYLSFPGRNDKMKIMMENAHKLLRGEQEKEDYYNDAALMGMLVMARDDGLLPEQEDSAGIDDGLRAWQANVEGRSSAELVAYRRGVEERWLLSKNDEKLHGKLAELEKQYPELMNRLLTDDESKGETTKIEK
jgi:hypothetical protein